jgi:hypothetical protein
MRERAVRMDLVFCPCSFTIQRSINTSATLDLIRTALCQSHSARIIPLAGESAGSDMTRAHGDQDALVLCWPIMIDQMKSLVEK